MPPTATDPRTPTPQHTAEIEEHTNPEQATHDVSRGAWPYLAPLFMVATFLALIAVTS